MKSIYLFGSLSNPRIQRSVDIVGSALAAHYRMRVVSETGIHTKTKPYDVISWRQYLYQKVETDAVPIYIVSGDPSQSYVYPFLFSNPGVVLFYDYYLGPGRLPFLKDNFSTEEILTELRYCFRSQKSSISYTSMLQDNTLSADMCSAPELCRAVLDSAICGISHNSDNVEALRLHTQHRPLFYVPLAIARPGLFETISASALRDLRSELALPHGAFVMGVFGTIQGSRSDRMLEILMTMRDQGCDAYLLFVGHSNAKQQADFIRADLRPFVRILVDVSDQQMMMLMKMVDVAYQLRFPPSGDFSLTLGELMASGCPVVALQHRFNAFLPDRACLRIKPTEETSELLKWTLRLWKEPDLRLAIGRTAREYIRINHTIDAMVSAFRGVIESFPYFCRNSAGLHPEFPRHLTPRNFNRVPDRLP